MLWRFYNLVPASYSRNKYNNKKTKSLFFGAQLIQVPTLFSYEQVNGRPLLKMVTSAIEKKERWADCTAGI